MKGLNGGRYRPLTDEEVERVHQSTLRVLAETGIQVHCPEALELFAVRGAPVDRERRIVRIPPAMLEDSIATVPRELLLCGREERHDLVLQERRVYLGTGGTALNVLDLETGEKRPSRLQDVREICRLVDALENIHFIVLPVFPNELPKERVDVNRFYAGLSNSSKHIMGGVYTLEGIREVIRMAEEIAGGAQRLRARPFVSFITCVISPLMIDRQYGELLMEVARHGLPCAIPSEALSAATAPITLAGNLVVLNAETLGGICLAQLVNPGTPVLYGSVASITDLRTMGYLSGAIEMGLINAAAAQLAQFYRIPYYATAGMSDAKLPDVQAGYEKALTSLAVALAGANYIHDAAGLLEFAMTASYESYVIDDEIIGMVMRAVRGIEVDEEGLALEVIQAVGPGGNFLTEEHTIRHLRTEFFLPRLSDRKNREEWIQAGALDARERARRIAQEILARHRPLPLPDGAEERIRGRIAGLIP